MRISICAGGSIKKGPERALIDDYIDRASRSARQSGFAGVQEIEVDLRSANTRASETQTILSKIPSGAVVIALDERGKALTSRQIASQFNSFKDRGERDLVFLIGGADGFEPGALPANMIKWSFGIQTWPHKLVRVMIAEQIYRSISILAGSPYHRD